VHHASFGTGGPLLRADLSSVPPKLRPRMFHVEHSTKGPYGRPCSVNLDFPLFHVEHFAGKA